MRNESKRAMFKVLVPLFCFLLVCVGGWAQEDPKSEKYAKLKKEGKIKQPAQVKYKGRYPVFANQREKPRAVAKPRNQRVSADLSRTDGASLNPARTDRTGTDLTGTGLMSTNSVDFGSPIFVPASPCGPIADPASDPSYTLAMAANDDESSAAIDLGFSFNFFGDQYTKVFINNNGNISFGSPYSSFTSTGFPSSTYNMIAPFWADVDTRGTGSGLVYYKLQSGRLTVVWYRVGYYNTQSDKLNTFELIITDGNDPFIGVGNNVAFIYNDVNWTTGSASGGSAGFGGTPATVGFNKGNGNNACYFFQQGRYDQPGYGYNGPAQVSGVDYLDHKCFYYNTSKLIDFAVDFSWVKSFCGFKFYALLENAYNYTVSAYHWDFGDGTSSTEKHPIHLYNAPGTYPVTFTITYQFLGECNTTATISKRKQVVFSPSEEVFKDTTLTVSTDLYEEIINSSAVTFSDAWPLEHPDENLNRLNSFANGAKGVWRAEGSYAYDELRSASGPVHLAKDGTYPFEQFNWSFSELDLIPKWRKMNAITEYSPYSYELENRDILNRYSAALYDYGGQFPSATGVNMRQGEMAFSSFEYLDGNSSGNWRLTNDAVPLYTHFKVRTGRNNYALVEASLAELENVTEVDVQGKTYWFKKQFLGQGHKIFCKKAFTENPNWTLVYFERNITGLPWKGVLIRRNQPQPVTQANLDATIAHAGKKSLKVEAAPLALKQELLQLEPGKTYLLSAWVSVNDANVATPKLADNLGIDLAFLDKQGNLVQQFSVAPSGRVIEGWQQLTGEFTCPAGKNTLTITFKPGSRGTAWYDDLRLHPVKGNLEAYVYDTDNFRLKATLDENNFAAFYYYDEEGRLYLTKKETEEGIKTITETVTHTPEKN